MSDFRFGPARATVSMEELRDLERELGMELDPDFRDFLVAHNDAEIVGDLSIGSRLIHDLVPVADQGRRRGIATTYKLMVDEWECPRTDLFPFAMDPGGYWFGVAARGPESNSIWIFVTDTVEPRSEKVAESFGDFLRNVRQHVPQAAEG